MYFLTVLELEVQDQEMGSIFPAEAFLLALGMADLTCVVTWPFSAHMPSVSPSFYKDTPTQCIGLQLTLRASIELNHL